MRKFTKYYCNNKALAVANLQYPLLIRPLPLMHMHNPKPVTSVTRNLRNLQRSVSSPGSVALLVVDRFIATGVFHETERLGGADLRGEVAPNNEVFDDPEVM